MSCVLRARGRDFNVETFLQGSSLKPLIVYHRGQQRFPGSKTQPDEYSGMNVSVSEGEFSDLASQIEDALQFLSQNAGELQRLRNFPGVEKLELDFPVENRETFVQHSTFPSTLISLMDTLKISLVVSLYPPQSR